MPTLRARLRRSARAKGAASRIVLVEPGLHQRPLGSPPVAPVLGCVAVRAKLLRYGPLLAIIAVGAAVRLWGIDFSSGLPKARPDEDGFILQSMLMFGGDLNPHWAAQGWPELFFFLSHFAIRAKLWWLELSHGVGSVNVGCLYALNPREIAVPVRLLACAFGVLTIPLAYQYARTLHRTAPGYAHPAGLMAAALVAFNAVHIRDSHFGVSDTTVTFFITLGMWQVARAMEGRSRVALVAAGLAIGLACSVKYAALPLIGVLALAAVGCFFQASGASARRAWFLIGVAALLAVGGGFVLGSPHVLDEPGVFLQGLLSHRERYAGSASAWGFEPGREHEYGAVFHGTVTLPFGFGWPGWALAVGGTLVGFWRCRSGALLTAFFVSAFFVAVLGPSSVLFVRYVEPIVPSLAVLATLVPVALCQRFLVDVRDGRFQLAAGVSVALLVTLPAWSTVQMVRRMTETDTRSQAAEWLVEHVSPEQRIRSEGGFIALPTIDDGLLEACWPAVPAELRRRAPTSGRASTDFDALVAQGQLGWGPVTREYLYHAQEEGTVREADFVVQSLPQLPCGEFVRTRSLTSLPACYHEVARFGPGAADCDTFYETFDMYMFPLKNYAGVERPGPLVQVLENRCDR